MKRKLIGKKVLITGGPTSVALDEMRVITNRSTGEMGRLISNACVKAGASVTLLEGAVTTDVLLDKKVLRHKFFLLDELQTQFMAALRKKPDIVIHAAAVSDFRPKKIFKGKVASCDKLTVTLVPTRKLIRDVKNTAPEAFLIGFKYEPSLAMASLEAHELITKARCDLVVANAVEKGRYRAVFVEDGAVLKDPFTSKQELVEHLVNLLNV